MPRTIRFPSLCGKNNDFVKIPLKFVNDRHVDVFARKNDKTLRDTLDHSRYTSLSEKCMADYHRCMDCPLGKFLLRLKRCGDSYYTRFLNRYGDRVYSTFSIANQFTTDARGVYAYCAGDQLKYIGRSKDSIRKRVNQGYGKIHPKNCYRDGQATNCHINACITAEASEVSLWLCELDNANKIEELERELIRQYLPPWNMQLT